MDTKIDLIISPFNSIANRYLHICVLRFSVLSFHVSIGYVVFALAGKTLNLFFSKQGFSYSLFLYKRLILIIVK